MLKRLFKKQTEQPSPDSFQASHEDSDNSSFIIPERPWIALIDCEEKVSQGLTSTGFFCTEGSFGSVIRLPIIKRLDPIFCRGGHNIPINLHEYDILIVNLEEKEPIEYNPSDHELEGGKSGRAISFKCSHPQSLFDQRPITCKIFEKDFHEFFKKESIVIVFASNYNNINYFPVLIKTDGYEHIDGEQFNNYQFLPSIPDYDNKVGIETNIVTKNTELAKILEKYNQDFGYQVVFTHPEIWSDEDDHYIPDPQFSPLLVNPSGKIVSYAQAIGESVILVFPTLEHPENLVKDLLQYFLPGICPQLFPNSTEFGWLKDPEYYLPNEEELFQTRKQLENDYEQKTNDINQEISINHKKYEHLHTLISGTGVKLVDAVEFYFNYLEFSKVINCDELNDGINEEDLQIEIDDGILVIEVKGIGGTSKDSECSQISKIKSRRAEERKAFDVFALYLVNHQRFLPPNERNNPPFSPQQIQDAENDKRGLLTTYNLFKLYFLIEEGLISKKAVRLSLLSYGQVEFSPTNCVLIGTPLELHYKNHVGIFEVTGIELKIGDEVLIKDKNKWNRVIIESLMVKNNEVTKVTNGVVGIKFSESISTDSELWTLINQ